MSIRPDEKDLPVEDNDEVGPGSAGQAGDLQGIADLEGYDSEDVRDLLEEGQAFEASVITGIENAPPADEGEIKTRQFPEDDVPPEYWQEKESER